MTPHVRVLLITRKWLCTFCMSMRHILLLDLNILFTIFLSLGNCMTSLLIICWTFLWLLTSFRFGDSTINIWSWCRVLSEPLISILSFIDIKFVKIYIVRKTMFIFFLPIHTCMYVCTPSFVSDITDLQKLSVWQCSVTKFIQKEMFVVRCCLFMCYIHCNVLLSMFQCNSVTISLCA